MLKVNENHLSGHFWIINCCNLPQSSKKEKSIVFLASTFKRTTQKKGVEILFDSQKDNASELENACLFYFLDVIYKLIILINTSSYICCNFFYLIFISFINETISNSSAKKDSRQSKSTNFSRHIKRKTKEYKFGIMS